MARRSSLLGRRRQRITTAKPNALLAKTFGVSTRPHFLPLNALSRGILAKINNRREASCHVVVFVAAKTKTEAMRRRVDPRLHHKPLLARRSQPHGGGGYDA